MAYTSETRRKFGGVGMSIIKSFVVGIAALGMTASIGSAADWKPKKPVEFIIMAGTGGGADQIARLLQGLIEQKGLSSRPFIPINKPGGSGAEALRYLQDKAGDDHTVMMTLNSFYTTPIIQEGLGVDVTKFTPIGLMAMDTFLLWVNTDMEDINDLDSYVAAVKAKFSEALGDGAVALKYRDFEGDFVTVTSRTDLRSALSTAVSALEREAKRTGKPSSVAPGGLAPVELEVVRVASAPSETPDVVTPENVGRADAAPGDDDCL